MAKSRKRKGPSGLKGRKGPNGPKRPPRGVPPAAPDPPDAPTSGLEVDDAALWRRVAGGVTPLSGEKRQKSTKPARTATPEAAARGEAATGTPAGTDQRGTPPPIPLPPAPPPEQISVQPPLVVGAASGIDKRTATRLRRGQLSIDARLDLHGMIQQEAFRALSLFIEESQESGARCVLVITGKGLKPDGSTGVLRDALPGWLNRAELRPLVLALNHAQPRDGGQGAFYVLLRRNR